MRISPCSRKNEEALGWYQIFGNTTQDAESYTPYGVALQRYNLALAQIALHNK